MNLRPVFGAVAMAFLPWSIPCWAIATAVYRCTNISKNDESGDVALMVLLAPAFIPALAYDRLKCAIKNFNKGYH